MQIEVAHRFVATEDDAFDGGVHDIEKPSKDLLKGIALGVHHGVVKVLEASAQEEKGLKGHVEDEEDSLAAQEKAQEAGLWQLGNLQNYIDTQRYFAEREDLDDEVRALAKEQADEAEAQLKALEKEGKDG
jgi:hypothetical protein